MAYKLKQTRKSLTIQTTILIFILSFSLYLFIQSDFFLLKNIEVKGNRTLGKEKIIELADLPLNSDMFYLDLQTVSENLKMYPMLKDVDIYRKLPDTVVIEVEERTPLALMPYSEGFILLGKEFTVLNKVTEISPYKLPLLTGFSLPGGLKNGQKISLEELQFAKDVIDSTWESVQDNFCEINLATKENIKMYTYEGIEVHFGDLENFDDKYNLFKSLYEGKSVSKLTEIKYIDVSFEGLPVVKYDNNN